MYARASMCLATMAFSLAVTPALIGCGADEGRPDSELGNLVLSPANAPPKIDVASASGDVDALLDIIALPHTWTSKTLEAHRVSGTSSVQVTEDGQLLEELQDVLHLRIDSDGHYQLTLDNSKEYGQHAIFDGTRLYLRPRFGLYHARAPQRESEAGDIRDQVFAGASEYLALLSSYLEVSDSGVGTLENRDVHNIELRLAPQRRKTITEDLDHRKWRDSIVVSALTGSVALDQKSGAVLQLKFSGSLSFVRDGKRLHMTLQAERTITQIGQEQNIERPSDDEILEIAARRRELQERDQLLKNIAPPARKAPTPTTPTTSTQGPSQ